LVDDSGGVEKYKQIAQLRWSTEEQQQGKLIKIKNFPRDKVVKNRYSSGREAIASAFGCVGIHSFAQTIFRPTLNQYSCTNENTERL